jgi:hypothetical protein
VHAWAWAVALGTLTAPVPAHAQEAGWTAVRTPRFTVYSQAAPVEAQRVARALEAFRGAFMRLVPGARVDPLAPTIVFAFDRFAAYEPFAPRYEGRALRVAGSFVGGERANYLALTLDEGPRAWAVAYHELTHLIISQTMREAPAWFNEGVAEYYGTFTLLPGGAEGELAHLIPEHLLLLRQERWLPMEELFEVTTASPLYNEGDKRSMFYAQSWAVIHYLLSRGPDRTAPLFEFLDRVAGGQSTIPAFRAAFGMAPTTLADEVRRYLDRPEWPVSRYTLGPGSADDVELRAEPLSAPAALAALSGMQLHLSRPDEALALARSAVDADPAAAPAWAMLAAVHSALDLDLEAVPFLLRAAPRPPADPLSQFLLGDSALRVAERVTDSELPRDRALALSTGMLERAVAGHPAYAEAWATLAHASLATGISADRALSASRRARALAPWRRHYALLEAQARMQRGELVEARRLMNELIEADPGTALGDRAAEVLAAISAIEEADASRRGGRADPGAER